MKKYTKSELAVFENIVNGFNYITDKYVNCIDAGHIESLPADEAGLIWEIVDSTMHDKYCDGEMVFNEAPKWFEALGSRFYIDKINTMKTDKRYIKIVDAINERDGK